MNNCLNYVSSVAATLLLVHSNDDELPSPTGRIWRWSSSAIIWNKNSQSFDFKQKKRITAQPSMFLGFSFPSLLISDIWCPQNNNIKKTSDIKSVSDWCSYKNLSLNIKKQKEVIDFRRQRGALRPLESGGEEDEGVLALYFWELPSMRSLNGQRMVLLL